MCNVYQVDSEHLMLFATVCTMYAYSYVFIYFQFYRNSFEPTETVSLGKKIVIIMKMKIVFMGIFSVCSGSWCAHTLNLHIKFCQCLRNGVYERERMKKKNRNYEMQKTIKADDRETFSDQHFQVKVKLWLLLLHAAFGISFFCVYVCVSVFFFSQFRCCFYFVLSSNGFFLLFNVTSTRTHKMYNNNNNNQPLCTCNEIRTKQ